MRVTGVRELRSQLSAVLAEHEPVLVTRHGKISGIFLPLEDPKRLPPDLRAELAMVLGRHLDRQLQARGISEDEVQSEFDAHRRRRRRR